MSGRLAPILSSVREALEERRRRLPVEELVGALDRVPAPRGFAEALGRWDARRGPALIAELKRASPSAGLIREPFEPRAVARSYEEAGAACVSVLTEPRFFQGDPAHLRAVRNTVGLPLLRKDFVVDPYQVYEARVIGADAVLLIVAVLGAGGIEECLAACRHAGLDALVEVHDRAELEVALDRGATLIGVNNRDLRTFSTRLEVTRELAPLVPPDRILVSESGITSRDDVLRVGAWGARAVLVGEALMRAADPGALARSLLGGEEP